MAVRLAQPAGGARRGQDKKKEKMKLKIKIIKMKRIKIYNKKRWYRWTERK